MHYKKRKLHKLYSIPIGLCNKERLYLVSYSIPLSCMVVLLLGLGFMINPGLFLVDKSSAVTIRDEWTVKNPDEFASIESAEPDVQNTDVINDNAEGDNDSGIMPMAENPDGEDTEPSITLTVTNTDQVVQAAQGGSTVYGSYRIGISGVGITEYTLSIKADSVNLIPPSGSSSIISGAGNKTGNNMAAGTWGYALTDTSTATSNYANLTYKNLPTVDTAILSDKGIMEWRLGVDKDLIFAAKFGEDVTPGNYSSHITLNVVATPRVTTAKWSNGVDSLITTMQEVESGFCKNNSKIGTGNTITLKDNRDGNSYALVKLKDGNCWMQQNLKLGGSSAMTLTSTDTALASGTSSWSLPASSDSSWSSSNTLAQIRVGKSGMTVNSSYPGDGNGWQSNYGNYYSWCAATAGSCSSATSSGAVAGGSICPKNWHLPTGNTNGEFYNVLNGLNFTTVQQNPYYFPAAGNIDDSAGFIYPGTAGHYWSSTAGSSTNAYYLGFSSGSFNPGTSAYYRYIGYSVRCVADY